MKGMYAAKQSLQSKNAKSFTPEHTIKIGAGVSTVKLTIVKSCVALNVDRKPALNY